MGLDKDRVVDKDTIIEELMCSICTDIVEDPVQGQCQHSFCNECIRQWLNNGKSSCPVDRQSLTISELKPTRILQQLLNKATIRCKNYQKGCRLLAKYEDMHYLIDHETNQCLQQNGSLYQENKNLQKAIENLEIKLIEKDNKIHDQCQRLSLLESSSSSTVRGAGDGKHICKTKT